MFVRIAPYIIIYFVIDTLLRVSLLIRSMFGVDYNFVDMMKVMLVGLGADVVTLGFFLVPIILYNLFLPRSLYGKRFDRISNSIIFFVFTYLLLFDAVAEHLFWSEFSSRFNFIAVDYLVYTNEVIGNIIESFPIYKLLLGIAIVSLTCTIIFVYYCGCLYHTSLSFYSRFKKYSALLIILFLPYMFLKVETIWDTFGNAEAKEVASNGVYNLFYAFWNNEINYERFYLMQPEDKVERNIERLLSSSSPDQISQEQHYNVIIVVMESMGAEYMASFGNKENLTPNLDRLSEEGVSFHSLYATGTRTVRGLEAITLSVPPTPGQSIVRRTGNDNLFSIGFLFRERGYDTKFIYGGFGYFDNMNAFFASNGFDVVDRTNMSNHEIQFANIWGVCDEDLFKRVISEADQSYQHNKKFMHVVMTTSNHRPFTFPNGKIDIPSHQGRSGGVKYSDYSIGELIKSAQQKPWFKDTIFVFVADHTAGAGGKVELNLEKYHIPLIFYAPYILTPNQYKEIASQIDLAPTLLGLMHFNYDSKFFGRDLLNHPPETPRAFISNYQKVALIENSIITILSPQEKIMQYSWPEGMVLKQLNQQAIDDTVAYYQSASKWRQNHKFNFRSY